MNDNSRTATILLSVLLLLIAIGFSIGLGYFVRGWASNGARNIASPIGVSIGGNLTGFYNPQNCSEGQYSRWNGTAWVCANDLVGGARGPQGPQGIQGPPGPPGGGSILTYGTTPQTCYSGQYSRWNGSYWVCETDRVGSGGGGYYDYDRPVACSSGQYSRYTGSYWTCETDRIGGGGSGGGDYYYAGTGLTLNGNTFSLTGLQACSSNQYSRWTGSQWVCANDQGGGGGGGASGASVGYAGSPSNSNFVAGGNNSGGSSMFPADRQNFTVTCPQDHVMTGVTLTDSGDGASRSYRVKGITCVALKNF